MGNEDSRLLLTHMTHFVYIFPVHRSLPNIFSSTLLSSFIPKDWNLMNYTSMHNMHPRMKLLSLGKRKGKGLVWARKDESRPQNACSSSEGKAEAAWKDEWGSSGLGGARPRPRPRRDPTAVACALLSPRYPTSKPTTLVYFSHTLKKSLEKHCCMGFPWGIYSTHLLKNRIYQSRLLTNQYINHIFLFS